MRVIRLKKRFAIALLAVAVGLGAGAAYVLGGGDAGTAAPATETSVYSLGQPQFASGSTADMLKLASARIGFDIRIPPYLPPDAKVTSMGLDERKPGADIRHRAILEIDSPIGQIVADEQSMPTTFGSEVVPVQTGRQTGTVYRFESPTSVTYALETASRSYIVTITPAQGFAKASADGELRKLIESLPGD